MSGVESSRNCALFSNKGTQTISDENEHYNLSYVVLGQHFGMHLSCKLRNACQ